MSRSSRTFGPLLTAALVLGLAAGRSAADTVVVGPPPAVACYPPPQAVPYAAPASVSYYAPPAVSYYAPPAVSYYAPPAASYYAAPAPAAVETATYRYGLFGRPRVVRYYYSPVVAYP